MIFVMWALWYFLSVGFFCDPTQGQGPDSGSFSDSRNGLIFVMLLRLAQRTDFGHGSLQSLKGIFSGPAAPIRAQKGCGFVEIPANQGVAPLAWAGCFHLKSAFQTVESDSRNGPVSVMAVFQGHLCGPGRPQHNNQRPKSMKLCRDNCELMGRASWPEHCEQDAYIRNRLFRLSQQRDFRPCRLSGIKFHPELQICLASGSGFAKILANQDRTCMPRHSVKKISSGEKFWSKTLNPWSLILVLFLIKCMWCTTCHGKVIFGFSSAE